MDRNQLISSDAGGSFARRLQGVPFQIDYGKRQLRNDNFRFVPGDEVYVEVDKTPNNVLQAYYVDYVRTTTASDSADCFHRFHVDHGALERAGQFGFVRRQHGDDYRLRDPAYSRRRRPGQSQLDRFRDSFSGNVISDLWLES